VKLPVVVLCGGFGTRLREETEVRPKPMVEIGGRPILWHIMKLYAHYGHTDFVLCLGYKAEIIKRYFLNYEAMSNDFTVQLGAPDRIRVHRDRERSEHGWTVTLADTGLHAQTGARVKRIEKYIDGDAFMLTYGDGVADVDIAELLRFHAEHGKIGTVTGVRPPSRFGELMTEADAVVRFSEKPQTSQSFINGGFFVFDRRFFDYLAAADDCVMEGKPLEDLARDGELMMFPHAGFWQCLDTPRDLQRLQEIWHRGTPPWRVWDHDG
jgi:glucose-1-phosphate cytidylyltransferase